MSCFLRMALLIWKFASLRGVSFPFRVRLSISAVVYLPLMCFVQEGRGFCPVNHCVHLLSMLLSLLTCNVILVLSCTSRLACHGIQCLSLTATIPRIYSYI